MTVDVIAERIKPITDSKQALNDFRATADRYRDLIESIGDSTPDESMAELRQLLPALYVCGLRLQLPKDINDGPDIVVPHEEWESIYASLADHFAGRCLYWGIFEPSKPEPDEPVAYDLADDLADIWRDLTTGQRILDSDHPDATIHAIWSWRYDFDIHWGGTIADAFRTIALYYARTIS